MKGEYKIAVLVDVPNTQELDYDNVLETIKIYGNIELQEAFFQESSGISFIKALRYKGFKTEVVGNLKDVDTTLAVRGSEIICSDRFKDIDLVTIVSGDSDYLPLIHMAKDYRKKTLVVACDDESFSGILRTSADYSEALEIRVRNGFNRRNDDLDNEEDNPIQSGIFRRRENTPQFLDGEGNPIQMRVSKRRENTQEMHEEILSNKSINEKYEIVDVLEWFKGTELTHDEYMRGQIIYSDERIITHNFIDIIKMMQISKDTNQLELSGKLLRPPALYETLSILAKEFFKKKDENKTQKFWEEIEKLKPKKYHGGNGISREKIMYGGLSGFTSCSMIMFNEKRDKIKVSAIPHDLFEVIEIWMEEDSISEISWDCIKSNFYYHSFDGEEIDIEKHDYLINPSVGKGDFKENPLAINLFGGRENVKEILEYLNEFYGRKPHFFVNPEGKNNIKFIGWRMSQNIMGADYHERDYLLKKK